MLGRSNFGEIWCRLVHDSITWPIHGYYRCRVCGRRYPAVWAVPFVPTRSYGRAGLPAPFSALLPALLLAFVLLRGEARAAEPVIANAVDGAADAFARYTAVQGNSAPWQMETLEIQASILKMAKQGRLRAIRKLLPFGRPQYQVLEVTGDPTVKREVIARYLSADAGASQLPTSSVAVTSANYKFHYNRSMPAANGLLYVFSIVPRKKREGLLKGELWLDADGFPVRQSGYLVKSPSIFIKRVNVARETRLHDGVAEARITHLTIDTRLVGKAEITIEERPLNPAVSLGF